MPKCQNSTLAYGDTQIENWTGMEPFVNIYPKLFSWAKAKQDCR